ncbi:hypothetical protein Taro_018974 [Colocasia esculenta]|uniref:Uncharacterized protein n=1 Tax=Colocasia esculenta TaxID=4460 RepID=A0A843UJZ2_COLES|nr:hypothetical protein [Colocasia esculenta]
MLCKIDNVISFVTCWGILPCSGLLSSDVGWYNHTGWKWVVAEMQWLEGLDVQACPFRMRN